MARHGSGQNGRRINSSIGQHERDKEDDYRVQQKWDKDIRAYRARLARRRFPKPVPLSIKPGSTRLPTSLSCSEDEAILLTILQAHYSDHNRLKVSRSWVMIEALIRMAEADGVDVGEELIAAIEQTRGRLSTPEPLPPERLTPEVQRRMMRAKRDIAKLMGKDVEELPGGKRSKGKLGG